MKKNMILYPFILLTLILTGCTTQSNAEEDPSPSQAVEQFYKHARNGELDKAEEYVAQEVLDYYKNNSNTLSGTLSYAMTDEGNRYSKVKGKDEKIKGQTAVVTAEITNKNNDTFDKDYNLIKEKDGWKLLFQ